MSDEAAPWVLLRGLARDARHWGASPGMLQERYPEARIVCVDLAGNGTRCEQDSFRSIADNAGDVAHQVSHLHAPKRVLAISMGAMVALEWARTAPAEIASLVLLNTSVRPFSPWWHRFKAARLPMLAAALLETNAARRERGILAATSNLHADEAIVERWSTWARDNPVSMKNALRQLRAAARYRIDARPDVPILFLASRNDRLVDPACTRAIAQAWHCPLDEHPQAGHDLSLDDPAWVVERIAQWPITASRPTTAP